MTTAEAGISIYKNLNKARKNRLMDVNNATPEMTVSDNGHSVKTTWKLDHRHRLIRTITYGRGDGAGHISIYNRLVTTSGRMLGINRSGDITVGRFHRQNFTDHVMMILVGTSSDPAIDGLRVLADEGNELNSSSAAAA